jgi:hypothetical protein
MSETSQKYLSRAVLGILRPLVRLLLRNGMSYAAFAELARRAYVETACADFAIAGRKPTVSRAAVVTGLTRKEVKRLLDSGPEGESETRLAYNRAARVVTGWVRDDDFRDATGEPAELSVDGSGAGDFPALVRRYSGDMPVRAVLDELARVGVVEETGAGRVRLLQRAYLPAGDDAQQLHILGTTAADLLRTMDHNLAGAGPYPLFQRTVSYDGIPRQALDAWRARAAEQSQRLLEEFDRLLASIDRDAAPDAAAATGERVRTGVGIFYFEEFNDEIRHRRISE